MREIRLSGSEGGGFECNRFSLPLSDVIVTIFCKPQQGRITCENIWSCHFANRLCRNLYDHRRKGSEDACGTCCV